jgi:hypothetical protein
MEAICGIPFDTVSNSIIGDPFGDPLEHFVMVKILEHIVRDAEAAK